MNWRVFEVIGNLAVSLKNKNQQGNYFACIVEKYLSKDKRLVNRPESIYDFSQGRKHAYI